MNKASSKVNNWIRQIHSALHAELRRSRGTVGRVEGLIGVRPGYWRAARSRETLDGVALLKTLEALGIEPKLFFAAALEGPSSPGTYEAEFLRRAPSKIPKELIDFYEEDEGHEGKDSSS